MNCRLIAKGANEQENGARKTTLATPQAWDEHKQKLGDDRIIYSKIIGKEINESRRSEIID